MPISKIEGEPHSPPPSDKEKSAQDKAAQRTATATVWIAVFTVILAIASGISLYAVIDGGKDTHELAVQAKNQADASQKLTENAVKQFNALSALADATSKQNAVLEK